MNGHQMLRLKARINPTFVNLRPAGGTQAHRMDATVLGRLGRRPPKAGPASIRRYAEVEARDGTTALRLRSRHDRQGPHPRRRWAVSPNNSWRPVFRSARPYKSVSAPSAPQSASGSTSSAARSRTSPCAERSDRDLSQIQRWMSGSFTGAADRPSRTCRCRKPNARNPRAAHPREPLRRPPSAPPASRGRNRRRESSPQIRSQIWQNASPTSPNSARKTRAPLRRRETWDGSSAER